jgi:hypothetical protein
MFALAAGKARTGRALENPVLRTEGQVTLIDGILAAAVLLGLVLNAALGWWWADPATGYVLVSLGAAPGAAAPTPPGDRTNMRWRENAAGARIRCTARCNTACRWPTCLGSVRVGRIALSAPAP